MPDPDLLAERVSSVVRRRTRPDQSAGVDRNQLTVVLASDGSFTPEMVDCGIERALEKGLIDVHDGAFVPGDRSPR
ncbi:MAG: hypothetical protein ABEJ06_05920 [Haloarculaceae archaeon]